ncbi:hypothetical protein GGI25_001394 [Coemansia spiralis]|uniref:Cullin family profile domain-containing protein n=2 Tax=Coemansia TaxID=4863 RepID=A0A9W8KZM4_9FUNG|nr:hypothetical protein EDC05_001259 [Coemansia umbellata]KAJ2624096.1 hypothetical protein GGI26_001889 [Coemansia sp. RSA 1358]KAJ2679704.1 hypothetical protein GGI25_001394 [Coemansia spiralis]
MAKLRNAVQAIQQSQPTPHGLEELYRDCEGLCIHSFGSELYAMLQDELEKYTRKCLSGISGLPDAASSDGTVLEQSMHFWLGYTQQLAMIKCVFLYLDRTYVLQTPNIASLWSMGLNVVKNYLINSDMRARLSWLIIGEVTKERDGKAVNHKPLVTVVSMFVELGLYLQLFMPSLIEATHEYYQRESRRLVGQLTPIQQQTDTEEKVFADTMDVPQYLLHVKRRLEEEAQRVSNYLVSSSKSALLATTTSELVEKHTEKLLTSSFDTIADRSMLSDLANLYSLLYAANRIETLKRHWVAYIKKSGLRMVQAPDIDVSLITDLLTFKQKVDSILDGPFQMSSMLANAMRDAFEDFLNTRRNKPIQLLAKYLDQCMRPSSKVTSDEQLDTLFEKALALFRLMQGKDLFEAHYRRDLAKRLLLNNSSSIDAEKLIVNKLKSECGVGYTSKIEEMFHDMDMSKDLFEKYSNSQYSTEAKDFGFHTNVLTTAVWPNYEPMDLVVPTKVEQAQENYLAFYKEKHSGRKLYWQQSLGTCVLKVQFDEGPKDLVLSLVQGTVMLLFAEHNDLSYKHIQENTALEGAELRRILQSLACGKHRVLVKEPRGKTISETDTFTFNSKFSSPHMRIKISQIITKEPEKENNEIEENIQADRMYRVDACIVRLLKARRRVDHSSLVSELAKQVNFAISAAEAKDRIEMLIERDYVKRDEAEPSTYHYVA